MAEERNQSQRSTELNPHCIRKKYPLTFLLYLHEKCLDFHKIFRKCSGGNNYSIDKN